MNKPKPVVLAILSGWGVFSHEENNALLQARTPNLDRFVREYPAMTLYSSGSEVGLSFEEPGNSITGHLNIGAGRICFNTLTRIDKTIRDGSFFENKAFLQAVEHAKKYKSTIHLVGLIDSSTKYSSLNHCLALLELLKNEKMRKVCLHVILDTKDKNGDDVVNIIQELEARMKEIREGKIASLSGWYYAMDRNNHWDRTEKAYQAMTGFPTDRVFIDSINAIEDFYSKDVGSNRHFLPVVIQKTKQADKVRSGDAVIFFNFQGDRMRQLIKAFALPGFNKFDHEKLEDTFFVTMTEYEKDLPVSIAFPREIIHNSLAETLANNGLTQLHIAETEKYPHITYFLNGRIEEIFKGEDHKIISSPQAFSYDQIPEMSTPEMSKEIIKTVHDEKYDVIFVNYSNFDSVAHTGNFSATTKAYESIGKWLGKVSDYILAKEGLLLIAGDYAISGNLINQEQTIDSSNTPVPFLVIGNEYRGQAGPAGDPPEGDLSLMHPVGNLADIAPTILKVLGIEQPKEMTGKPLI